MKILERKQYMKQIKKLNEQTFEQELQQDRVLVVDFGADWCPPCKALEPILFELQEQFPHVNFTKVDVEHELKLAERFSIKSLPTVLVFRKGTLTETVIGYRPKQQYVKILGDLIQE